MHLGLSREIRRIGREKTMALLLVFRPDYAIIPARVERVSQESR